MVGGYHEGWTQRYAKLSVRRSASERPGTIGGIKNEPRDQHQHGQMGGGPSGTRPEPTWTDWNTIDSSNSQFYLGHLWHRLQVT